MGKLLKILVVVLLVLSIGALTLGVMLFGKRELLKGRTQKLEETVIKLGKLVEAQPGTVDRPEQFPARDISAVTSELLENPERSDFWDSYKQNLELMDQPTLDLDKRREQLMHYYKLDPVTKKPVRGPQGYKLTMGEGTMQEVLDDLVDKSKEQYGLLNATRQQLKVTRTELTDVVEELNNQKQMRRGNLKKIDELNAEIDRLNAKVAELESRIQQLEEEKRALEDEISEQKRQIAELQEQITEKDATIADLKKKLDEALAGGGTPVGPGAVAAQPGAQEPVLNVPRGEKGQVIAVSPEYNFAILKVRDDFLKAVLGEELTGRMPSLDLLVRRGPGLEDAYVAKVRMLSLRRPENVVIADILSNWQQQPVEKGDVVIY